MVLFLQIVALCLMVIAIVLWWVYAPYPSPWVRRWLPDRHRWPIGQIRGWLQTGQFPRSFLKYVYRDPERIPPAGTAILAPADGRVSSVEIHNDRCYLVITLSFWDIHVQRSPVSGTIIKIESLGREFMMGAGHDRAFLREKYCPVQKRVMIASAWGEMAVRFITSLMERRIEIWVRELEPVVRGQRIGRIHLGSAVVLELPKTLQVVVRTGQRVWAGRTPVATPTLMP